jgi:hypothetical protein
VENKDNITQKLLAGLNSPDENTVARSLSELRVHGNKNILPAVFSLFFSKRMESLEEEIINLLNDVKDPDAVPVFMEAINKYRGKEKYSDLVSSCWQCGLDFSPYIDQFIELLLDDDYYTSLEAFSVIEENVSNLNSQQRNARLEFIRSKLELLSPEKRSLVNEVTSLLSDISGPFRLDSDHLN